MIDMNMRQSKVELDNRTHNTVSQTHDRLRKPSQVPLYAHRVAHRERDRRGNRLQPHGEQYEQGRAVRLRQQQQRLRGPWRVRRRSAHPDAVRIEMCHWFTLALEKTGDLCLAMALCN